MSKTNKLFEITQIEKLLCIFHVPIRFGGQYWDDQEKKNTFGLGKLHYYQTNMNLEVIVGSFVFSQFVYFFKKMHSDVWIKTTSTWKLTHQPIFSHIKTVKSISLCPNWR
jgi:hypothetical protein